MLVFQKVADIEEFLDNERRAGRTVGFAPTMGALHEGHLSLVQTAKRECDLVVVSIFVNPTQFNDLKDLDRYPRMPEEDIALLLSAHCDVLLLPPVAEIYPPGQDLTVQLHFRQLDKVMEGVFRPGHFIGMATVVKRLLDIVAPHRLYMGQKDFQQLSIVRDMLRQLSAPIELVMCATLREADGLAMSSRNMRLTDEMRRAAPAIYQTLQQSKIDFQSRSATVVQQAAMAKLREAGLKPEYFDIVDGISILPVEHWADSNFIVACTAAFAGTVRLIDNLVFQNE